MSTHGVVAENKQTGEKLYYTGKAGEQWLSPNPADAFVGYNEAGAMYKAGKFNAQHEGLWFSPYLAE
jgi:hypothetical protein